MARSLRLQYAGAIYHVTARGNERRAIYRDDGDRSQFLTCLEACVEAHRVRLYLFCLMPNHFHVVVETPRANLSAFMQSLLTRYTVYFNRRHRRRGHVTQGRYGAKLVETDGTGNRYLLALSRYVHLNPVHTRATRNWPLERRIEAVRQYPWSSYRGYVEAGSRRPWVEYGPVLGQMEGAAKAAAAAYRQYVESGLAETDEDILKALWASSHCVGSDNFRRWVEAQHQEAAQHAGSMEDVAFRRRAGRVPVEDMLKAVAGFCGVGPADIFRRQRATDTRGLAARWLCRYAGLTQRQVAKVLGLTTGAAISAQLRAVERRLAGDGALRERVAVAEAGLRRKERKVEQPPRKR